MKALLMAATAACAILVTSGAQAHSHYHHTSYRDVHHYTHHYGRVRTYSHHARRGGQGPVYSGSYGTVCTKRGNCARVAASQAGKFQGLIRAFEDMGYDVGSIGCLSGGHMPGSLHHTGNACDLFSQSARGVIHGHHPSDSVMNEVAARFGLTSGASWCSNDRGHFDTSGYNGCHARAYAYYRPRHRYRIAHR